MVKNLLIYKFTNLLRKEKEDTKMWKFSLAICLNFLFLFLFNQAKSAELFYTPVNPSFGGNSLNAQWLSSLAFAQNEFKEKAESSFTELDPMKSFEDNLTRQILSRLSYKIIEEAFGKEGLEQGHYEIGDYIIDIDNSGENIRLNLVNPKTGGTTIIEVPYYK